MKDTRKMILDQCRSGGSDLDGLLCSGGLVVQGILVFLFPWGLDGGSYHS